MPRWSAQQPRARSRVRAPKVTLRTPASFGLFASVRGLPCLRCMEPESRLVSTRPEASCPSQAFSPRAFAACSPGAGAALVWSPQGESVVAGSAEKFAAVELAHSGSARIDCLAAPTPVGFVPPTVVGHCAPVAEVAASMADAHSVPAAQLDGSVPVDCLAVLPLDDWVAPTAAGLFARAAEWDDSRVDCLAGPVLADSAVRMADDSAERDWLRLNARSRQAGCPGGWPVGSQAACWRVGPVWQHSVDSQVGLAGFRAAPCSASQVCLEAPV
jgi:hypothetical protein